MVYYSQISQITCLFFSIIPEQHKSKLKYITETKREINVHFNAELNKWNWNTVLHSTEPNKGYENFATVYKNTYEKCFPVKTVTRKRTKLASKLWITKGFITSIKSKCKVYKQFLCNPIPFNEEKYKKYKSKLNILLRISKRNSKFESAKGNLRFTWKLINEVINTKKSKF